MLYGLALPTGGDCGDPRFLVELAQLAEQSGWDGVFLEDYVWYALPRRRPWNVAREAAAIDRLSEGRLIVGFGAGDKGDPGFTHVHEPLDASSARSECRSAR